MHLSKLCPTTPLLGNVGNKGGDLNFANFKYPTYRASQVIKSPPCPLPSSIWGLAGDLYTSLANAVINLLHHRMPQCSFSFSRVCAIFCKNVQMQVNSQSRNPHLWGIHSYQSRSNAPLFPAYRPGGG